MDRQWMAFERIVFCRAAISTCVAAFFFLQATLCQAIPAVDQPNLRWLSGYGFSYLEDASFSSRRFPGLVAVVVPEAQAHDFRTGLVLTVPVLSRFGARVRIGAGAQRSDFESGLPGFGSYSDKIWSWQVNTGADFFLRDPEVGYVELGYRYRYNNLNAQPDLEEQNHIGILAAGLYFGGARHSGESLGAGEWDGSALSMGDLDFPPVDLELRFVYQRISLERQNRESIIPDYGLDALASVYLGDRLRIGLGGRYSHADTSSIGNLWRRDTRAVFELLWLPPVSGSQAITLGLNASGGEVREKGFFGSFDRSVATIGFEVGVLYPGGDSLVELIRQRF